MKIAKKIVMILIILLTVNIIFVNGVNAGSEVDDVIDEANNFVNVGITEANGVIEIEELTKKLLPVVQALRTIGIGIILCIGAFMGIKWVTAKPDEQAKLKQQSIGLLVAAIVVIGAFTIWSIALKIVSNL